MRRPKPQAGVHNAAGAIDHTAAVEISSTKSTFLWIHRLPWNIVFIHVIICVDVDCFLWSYLMKCKFTILHWPAAVTWTKALKCYRVTNWFKRWTLSLTNQFSNLHESYKIKLPNSTINAEKFWCCLYDDVMIVTEHVASFSMKAITRSSCIYLVLVSVGFGFTQIQFDSVTFSRETSVKN